VRDARAPFFSNLRRSGDFSISSFVPISIPARFYISVSIEKGFSGGGCVSKFPRGSIDPFSVSVYRSIDMRERASRSPSSSTSSSPSRRTSAGVRETGGRERPQVTLRRAYVTAAALQAREVGVGAASTRAREGTRLGF
jgi:hypothetical protein